MAKTTTKPAPAAAQLKEESTDNLPAINAPRLPYHPAIEQRFGLDKSAWKVLVESTWPNARTPDSVILALSYCKARNLDPFKRPVHIVPITVKKKINGKDEYVEIETVWPAISETRTTAFRTKDYAGMDPPVFGPTKTFALIDQEKDGGSYRDVPVKIDAPEWCQITVHRLVDGISRPFPGPRCYFVEFYAPKNRFVTAPNEQWRRKPSYMIEKCAEATALRRAFPEEYGDKYAIEELGSLGHLRTVDGSATFGAAPKAEPQPEPQREQFRAAAIGRSAAAGAQEEPPPRDEDPRGEGSGKPKDTPPADDPGPDDKQTPDDKQGGGEGRASYRVDGMGEEAIIKAIEKAIDDAGAGQIVEWIMADNADRLQKFSTNKENALRKRGADRIMTLEGSGT